MDRPYVFVSHIHEEAALAELLKKYIREDFLLMIDVFVSSDNDNISVGSRFLDNIDNALRTAKVELLVCSEESVRRPWLNFEAGAGWVKGIPIVPVCHTGLRPVDLPMPLNTLHAIEANRPQDLSRLYSLLANQLGSALPIGRFNELAQEVDAFEREYSRHRLAGSGAPHLLHHISLPVRDLQSSRSFYRELLSLEPWPQAPSRLERPPLPSERPDFGFDGAWFVLPTGQHLHLVENSSGTYRKSKEIDPRDTHFALRVRDFDCLKARLREMGREFRPDPLGMGYQQLYFLDEDLHVVEINSDL